MDIELKTISSAIYGTGWDSSVIVNMNENGLLNVETLRSDVEGRKTLSQIDIEHQLDSHEKWVETDRLQGDKAVFKNKNLSGKDLSGRSLNNISFVASNLSGANMASSNFTNVDLENADLRNADLTNIIFEPKNLPSVNLIASAQGLSTLKATHPTQIVALRNKFKSAGFREQERALTFALNHIETVTSIEDVFRYVMFELSSNWGLSPGRPLRIVGIIILVFGVFYASCLLSGRESLSIWKVWDTSKTLKEAKQTKLAKQLKPAWYYIPLWALYFSIVSTFHIGWRDLNVGSWLTRLQGEEYVLKTQGKLRTISGFQSLICIYLVVLWVLVYFGRPFE